MTPYSWSRRLYRLLLRIYPEEFRDRFGADLEHDFGDLIASRGRLRAWRSVVGDVAASLPSTYAHVRPARRRRRLLHPPGETIMQSLWFDLRHAIRALARAPIFTLVTVATLALGIGATSAIFSLVNAVLLRPPGFPEPERLVLMHEVIPESGVPRFGVSPADYLDIEQLQRSFAALGIYRTRFMELSGSGDPRQIAVTQLTPSVFAVLGVSADIGRTIVEDDARSGARVVVVSDGLWQSAYGGQPLVGEQITIDREPYTVVGIMPREFQFPRRGPAFNGEPADVWVPLVFNPYERQARGMFFNHSVIGRLRPGVTDAQLADEAARIGPRIRENYPPVLRQSPFSLVVQAAPLLEEVAGPVRRPLLILMGAVGLVLLVACANVANLILSRAVTRQHEIGLRVALGAARHRLVQMLLAEGAVLAALAGVAGLALAGWAIRAMPAAIAVSVPAASDASLDARVVAFTVAASAATALLFTLVPFAAGRREPAALLREEGARTTANRRQQFVQAALVVSSVAMAVVLLVASGLLTRSLTRLLAIEPGTGAEPVLTLRVALPVQGYGTAALVRAFYRTLPERLQALPGVRAAAIASDLPIHPDGERRAVTPERIGDAGGVPPSMAVTWVHGPYFQAFGIPLVRGRAFSSDEESMPREVAVVSRGFAERFWPGEDPIGKRLKWGIAASQLPWKTVVGVAGDVVDGAIGADPIPHVYVPYSDVPDEALASPLAGLIRRMVIVVGTAGDAGILTTPVRAQVAAVDPSLAVYDVATLAAIERDALAPQRFSALVLSGFAGGALLLAAVGLYGILAFSVAARTRELGVRMALGAGRGTMLGLVVGRGMRLTLAGLGLGALGAAAASRALGSLLFETPALDVPTFLVVPLVLAGVALLACYLPARRAARIDPMAALRSD
jgi:putative ABC transport system permease protein